MNFIDEKCIVIRITTLRNKQLLPTTYKQMKTGYMHKYIWTTIRNELLWDRHIENIVDKKILEFARRNPEDVHNRQVNIFNGEDKYALNAYLDVIELHLTYCWCTSVSQPNPVFILSFRIHKVINDVCTTKMLHHINCSFTLVLTLIFT